MKRVRHTSLPGLVGAAGLHGLLLAVLYGVEPPPAPARPARRPPVEVVLLERDRPPRPSRVREPERVPPRPEGAAAERPRPRARSRPRPAPRRVETRPRPATNDVAPQPAPAQAEPAPRPAPGVRRFTVAMEATVPSGQVAVPVSESGGGRVYGAAAASGDAPRGPGAPVAGPATEAPRRAAELTRLPRLAYQPPAVELRAAYPEAALRAGVEADVRLEILVSARGEVIRVRVLRSAGSGFDQAARELIRRFRFEPGRIGDRPVAAWIPWTYKFRLDG